VLFTSTSNYYIFLGHLEYRNLCPWGVPYCHGGVPSHYFIASLATPLPVSSAFSCMLLQYNVNAYYIQTLTRQCFLYPTSDIPPPPEKSSSILQVGSGSLLPFLLQPRETPNPPRSSFLAIANLGTMQLHPHTHSA
jgi:hypothetical protein